MIAGCNYFSTLGAPVENLFNKYHVYNADYKNCCEHGFNPGEPQLLDALSTGTQTALAKYSIKQYDASVEKDIRDILQLMPKSLHCDLGRQRVFEKITPLYAACYNANIPVSIIKLLLDNGANPYLMGVKGGLTVADLSVRLSDLWNHRQLVGGEKRVGEISELLVVYAAFHKETLQRRVKLREQELEEGEIPFPVRKNVKTHLETEEDVITVKKNKEEKLESTAEILDVEFSESENMDFEKLFNNF